MPAFVHEMLRSGQLPNLAKLIEGGAFADDVIPCFPSLTAPGFASLWTGAPPRITGISGNRVPRLPRSQFTILRAVPGLTTSSCKRSPSGHQPSALGGESLLHMSPSAATNRTEGYIFKVIVALPDATG